MQIDRETIVKLARESYIFPTQEKDDNGTGMWFTFTVYKGSIDALEKFAKLVAEHEREAIIATLKGIDETEIESPDGWWETSTGAEFGASILAAIRARNNNA